LESPNAQMDAIGIAADKHQSSHLLRMSTTLRLIHSGSCRHQIPDENKEGREPHFTRGPVGNAVHVLRMEAEMKNYGNVLFAGALGFSVTGIAACANGVGTEGQIGQSLDPLLVGDGGVGAVARDGGENACPSCIQQSCNSQLTALETELQSLRSEAMSAFTCVRNDSCLSLYWNDAGTGGTAAVGACIASCDADAGLPDRDAARSEISSVADSLEQCVQSSCSSECPAAAAHGDGGFVPPRFDGGFTPPHFDGGFTPPPFGGGFAPPPFDGGFTLPHFDGGSFTPPACDGGFGHW
jgi:hypothetical protein